MQEEQDTEVKRALRDEEEGGWKAGGRDRGENTRGELGERVYYGE